MAGASILAGRAAFRIGSGLVSIASPSCNRVIMQSQLPEAMFLSVGHEQLDEIDFDVNSFTCLCVGTGLGQAEETKLALKSLLNEVEIPIVIDADALNIIASFSEKKFPKHSIITPHPKEFDRLFGDSVDDFERRSLQKRMSAKHDIIIILKGAYSTISFPDGQFYYNSTGNPGMAVGGSGDILSGTIAGLLAQGYTGLESALLGTYIHGLAGDIAAKNLGQMNMISSDMIDQYSLALNMIK